MSSLVGRLLAEVGIDPNETSSEKIAMTKARQYGFDLILLDRDQPSKYCKCRIGNFHRLNHEIQMMEIFQRSVASDVVIQSCGANVGPWTIQSTQYVSGPVFSRWRIGKSQRDINDAIISILEASDRLSVVAQSAGAGFSVKSIDLQSESRPCVKYLQAEGSEIANASTLLAWLGEIAPLASQPQHGDLWAENALLEHDQWRIIDLELFGMTSVPLYDVFHMLRTHYESIQSTPWLLQLTNEQTRKFCHLAIFKVARQQNLSARQVIGSYIYYSLHQAATTLQDPIRASAAKRAAVNNLSCASRLLLKRKLGDALGFEGCDAINGQEKH